jgi:hypothetical protein
MMENVECHNLATCIFVKYYETSKGNNLALKGFISTYCKGKEQDKCKRKKVSKALGGPMHVPPNMMPNGMALAGTNTAQWPKEVAALV